MECLYDLHVSQCDDSYIKMKKILENLGKHVSKTQLTNIVQRKLVKLGYVDYIQYEGVRLTPEGYKIATLVARNHRLAEAMLFQIFKVPFKIIHEQACLLEHSISDITAYPPPTRYIKILRNSSRGKYYHSKLKQGFLKSNFTGQHQKLPKLCHSIELVN